MKSFSILLITFVSVLSHAGWKDVGGGNGVGGTLLDAYEAGAQTQLDGTELYATLMSAYGSRFSQLEMLGRFALKLFVVPRGSKSWYLDDRKFAKECLNQTTLDVPNVAILACQNDVEVRINRAWWNAASVEQRALLLLHETFTAMALEIGNVNQVHVGVNAFVAPNFVAKDVRDRLWSLGFVFVPTRDELVHIRQMVAASLPKVCTARNSNGAVLKASGLAKDLMESEDPNLVAIVTYAMFEVIDEDVWTAMCTTPAALTVDRYVELGWFDLIVPTQDKK